MLQKKGTAQKASNYLYSCSSVLAVELAKTAGRPHILPAREVWDKPPPNLPKGRKPNKNGASSIRVLTCLLTQYRR